MLDDDEPKTGKFLAGASLHEEESINHALHARATRKECGIRPMTTGILNAAEMRYYKRLVTAVENTGTPQVHVKNGKPLTEHGARLLGVPWPTKE